MNAFTINSVLKNFGTTIPRAPCWILRNPALDAGDPQAHKTIDNCPARLVELHDYLIAGWQLVNDTESLAGYSTPPAITGDGAPMTDSGNEER